MDHVIKTRVQQRLGRMQYRCKNHVVVCGLGRLGFFVAEELIQRGEQVIIIEENENNESIDHFRKRGAKVYIGNAKFLQVLQDVNIENGQRSTVVAPGMLLFLITAVGSLLLGFILLRLFKQQEKD